MKISSVFVLCTLGLVSCAKPSPTVTSTYTVDGRKAYTIDCGKHGAIACQTEAGNICRDNGYQDINETADRAVNHSLMIVCNQSTEEVSKELMTTMQRQCPSVATSLTASNAKPDYIQFMANVELVRRGDSHLRDAAAQLCCANQAFAARFASPTKSGDSMDPQIQQQLAELNCGAFLDRTK